MNVKITDRVIIFYTFKFKIGILTLNPVTSLHFSFATEDVSHCFSAERTPAGAARSQQLLPCTQACVLAGL